MTSGAGEGTALTVALVVGGFLILFTWVLGRPFVSGDYLAESDLYEYYLPIFLSPITTWSSYEFAGLPAFADPGDSAPYPLHFLFARLVGSWTAFAISAFVVAAVGTYAYIYCITRSIGAATFAGIAFGLSEALMERLPHMATLHVFIWLPLIVLSLDRLRATRDLRWVAGGAIAVGCSILAGHPQPTIMIAYVCGLYALVGGLAERAPRRYYISVVVLFGLGGTNIRILDSRHQPTALMDSLIPFIH